MDLMTYVLEMNLLKFKNSLYRGQVRYRMTTHVLVHMLLGAN